MKDFDYIIIGGGCAGLTLAYELEYHDKLKNKTLAIIEKRYSYAFSDILVCTKNEIKEVSKYIKKINFIIPYLSRIGFKKLNNLSKNSEKKIFLKLNKFNLKKLNIIKKK